MPIPGGSLDGLLGVPLRKRTDFAPIRWPLCNYASSALCIAQFWREIRQVDAKRRCRGAYEEAAAVARRPRDPVRAMKIVGRPKRSHTSGGRR